MSQQITDIEKTAKEIKKLYLDIPYKDKAYASYFTNVMLNYDSHKELFLKLVEDIPRVVWYGSPSIKSDYDIMLKAAIEDRQTLFQITDTLKDNEDFIKEIIGFNGIDIGFATERVRNNIEIVKRAFDTNYQSLKYATKQMQGNVELFTYAVKQYGNALEYANEDIRSNEEILRLAIKNNPHCIKYMHKQTPNKKQLVIAAVTQKPYALQDCSQGMKNNKDVVFAAVSKEGYVLQYASNKMRNDELIVATALENNKDSYQFAGKLLQEQIEESGRAPSDYLNSWLMNDRLQKTIPNTNTKPVKKIKI